MRGSCEDGSQEMLWNYPLAAINLTVHCASYTFQALTSEDMPVGFPFAVQVASFTTMGEFE